MVDVYFRSAWCEDDLLNEILDRLVNGRANTRFLVSLMPQMFDAYDQVVVFLFVLSIIMLYQFYLR